MLALAGASCFGPAPSQQATSTAEALSRGLLVEGRSTALDPIPGVSPTARELVARLAAPPRRMTPQAPRRVGPNLWSVRVELQDLKLRDLRTGTVLSTSGWLETEIRILGEGKAVPVSLTADAGIWLGPDPYRR